MLPLLSRAPTLLWSQVWAGLVCVKLSLFPGWWSRRCPQLQGPATISAQPLQSLLTMYIPTGVPVTSYGVPLPSLLSHCSHCSLCTYPPAYLLPATVSRHHHCSATAVTAHYIHTHRRTCYHHCSATAVTAHYVHTYPPAYL